MKKALFLIIALIVVFACSTDVAAYAEQSNDYMQDFAYLFIKDFIEKFPNREAGIAVNNPADSPLQKYLTEKLVSASNGLIASDDVKYYSFDVSDINNGYNIEVRLDKQGTEKQIIIGAHYDSKGEGANDNASGVAALLKVLSVLSGNVDKLPCDVVFVLFDAEELGMLGSYNYVEQMSKADIDNTLVMFNMDSIANGDNLYVWCENKRTDLADLILTKNNKLTEKPYAKGTYNIDGGNGYGYIETPQNSDQTPFRVAGIPTALFFSGTYSADPWNYAESKDPLKNTMNSPVDTLENLDKDKNGEFISKINATADAICATILDDSFLTVAEAQRKQLVNLGVLGNSWWASLICGVILIVFVIIAVVYYRRLQKGAILGTAEIKTNKVFSTPNAEDIFTFDNRKSTDGKPSVEEIFTIDDKTKK